MGVQTVQSESHRKKKSRQGKIRTHQLGETQTSGGTTKSAAWKLLSRNYHGGKSSKAPRADVRLLFHGTENIFQTQTSSASRARSQNRHSPGLRAPERQPRGRTLKKVFNRRDRPIYKKGVSCRSRNTSEKRASHTKERKYSLINYLRSSVVPRSQVSPGLVKCSWYEKGFTRTVCTGCTRHDFSRKIDCKHADACPKSECPGRTIK